MRRELIDCIEGLLQLNFAFPEEGRREGKMSRCDGDPAPPDRELGEKNLTRDVTCKVGRATLACLRAGNRLRIERPSMLLGKWAARASLSPSPEKRW